MTAALAQCRRVVLEAGPAVLGAGVLASFAALTGDGTEARAAAPPALWSRETAPLVVALVACGPLAAARAGELARLRLDDQLDALRVMGGSVARHLVRPRLLAGALALPLLVLLADAAGLAIGHLIAQLGGAPRAAAVLEGADVARGLARGVLFGVALAAVACAAGLAPPPPGRERDRRAVARAAARAGAGGAVAVLALHVALGGRVPW